MTQSARRAAVVVLLRTCYVFVVAVRNIADIPLTGLSAFIANLARRHRVVYARTGSSALAQVITRLADDEAKPDEVEKLVIALRRSDVIDGPTMVTLLGRYFDETCGVRSLR